MIENDEALAFIREQQRVRFGIPGEWFQIAIADRETDALVGDVGVCIRPDDPTCAEIGFSMAREHHGKGLASESVNAVLAILFEETEIQRIEAVTDTRNIASVQLLRRIGMRLQKTQQAWFKESLCDEHTFVLSKQDWRSDNVV